MNEYEIMIKNLENRVTELEKLTVCRGPSTLTIGKWQPTSGDWCIYGTGEICEDGTSEESQDFGTERATRAQAERAAIEMRRFNRLLALRDELCGDEFVDFSNTDPKYYIQYVHTSKKWDIPYNNYSEATVPYFSNLKAAQKACDMLNSGEVEL